MRDVRGLLFGLALGEIIGAELLQKLPDPARYGADARLTFLLTEMLLDAGGTDLDAHAAFDDLSLSGISAACVAGIGYLYQNDERRLRETVEALNVQHDSPGLAATLAAAYALKLAVDGLPVARYLRRILTFTDGISAEFDAAIYRVGHACAWSDENAALDHIGRGSTVGVVAAALYHVIRYPDDYAVCVRHAANAGAEAASVACIAGGIMGARLGAEAIPAAWLDRCEDRAYLEELGARMARFAVKVRGNDESS